MSIGKLDTTPLDRPRGRPRSAVCDDAILDAAWRLLGEVGYARLSMERIAQEAGVGKPTLYLRYACKADVVGAAFSRLRLERAPQPTGDLVADLAAQLDHIRTAMDGVGMALVGTCLAKEEHVPDLIERLRDLSLGPGRELVRGMLRDAVAHGALPSDADIETALEMAIGAYYAIRISGAPFDEGWAERIAAAAVRLLKAAR